MPIFKFIVYYLLIECVSFSSVSPEPTAYPSRSNVWTQPEASQGRSTNEGARKFRAYHSRSFFSNTNGMEFHQLNITEIITLRRLKGMDLNVRLKILSSSM